MSKQPPLTAYERGIVAYLAYGRMTQAEACTALQCHRTQLVRLLANLDIDTLSARRAYVATLMRRAEGTGFRPLTKAQLRARGARTLSDFDHEKS